MAQAITPEITENQSFYQIIKVLASQDQHITMLEIGASNGLGSTQAFIQGILTREAPQQARLYCLELGLAAFEELQVNTGMHGFIHCYQESSCAVADVPAWDDVVHFYQSKKTYLNDYSLDTVRGWYDACLNYALQTGHTGNGIQKIKAENHIKNFDLVLIDGSEFTGEQDVYSTLGAKTIVLDDCMTYKCHQAFQTLMSHHSYSLVAANMEERHGYAVFRRRY
jgi:hypothetical protein